MASKLTTAANLSKASKPTTAAKKPKKSLTAYNLFYRYKRAKIIEANGLDKNAIYRLAEVAPGLEDYPRTDQTQSLIDLIPPDRLEEIRRANIRMVIGQKEKLLAKDTGKKRPHRKQTSHHGFSMSFVEMNKLMVDNWRVCDRLARGVFQELAEEGRKIYQVRLADYKKLVARDKAEMVWSSLDRQDFKMPKLDRLASDEEAPSTSVKTKSPASTSIKESLGKSELDLSWEPLPFEDQDIPKASSTREVSFTSSEVEYKTIPEARMRLLSEERLDQPKSVQHPSYHSPVVHKACIPAIVTPTTVAKPSVIPTSMDRFDANSNGMIEPISNLAPSNGIPAIVTPTAVAKPSVISTSMNRFDANSNGMLEPISHLAPPNALLFALPPPPLIFESEGPSVGTEEESVGSPGASFESVASVDDFMELIAALD